MNNNKLIVFVGMGFELVGIILACIYLGRVLDEQLGLKGIGLALTPMLGLVGWIVQIVYMTKKLDKSNDESDQGSGTN